jgi:polyhydroxybutyrate depolymerase
MFFLFFSSILAADLAPGDHSPSPESGGRTRDYIIHVPLRYTGKKETPVVLVFHGGAMNAKAIKLHTKMDKKSDEAGFIAVYPNGTGRLKNILTWNGGNCCGYAMRNKVDDVAFVNDLLDDLAEVVNVDPHRVYATGISNGAIISYQLASKLSDRIAAIAPIAGPMGTETCAPTRPVPVIHFHGTDDTSAPSEGGRGKGLTRTNFYSVEHSIDHWVKANGCETKPTTQKLEDKHEDGTTVIQKTWGNGKHGAEVVLLRIEGGGHTWPGLQPHLKYLGTSTREISANDMMWEFFKKHPMPK